MQDKIQEFFDYCKGYFTLMMELTHEVFLPRPVMDDTAVQETMDDLKKLVFQKTAFPVPEWTADISNRLIDWNSIIERNYPDGRDAVLEIMNERSFDKLYTFSNNKELQEFGEKLAGNEDFIGRMELVALVVTEAMKSGRFVTALRPEWFLFDDDGRIWCNWQELEKNSISSSDRGIERFELGFMHPDLRQCNIPEEWDYFRAPVYAFVCFLLRALTRMPQAADMKAFYAQIDRFRVYNSGLSPFLRQFFASVLIVADSNPYKTPIEAYDEFKLRLKDIDERLNEPFRPMKLSWKRDSVFGKKKRKNENEDAIVILENLPLHQAVIGVADGVSTADIGSGWLAATYIKLAFAQNNTEWCRRMASLPDPGNDRKSWQEAADNLLRDIFCTVHQEVCRQIGLLLKNHDDTPSLSSSSGQISTMSSTLVLAIVHGNYVRFAHLGDSRIYLTGSDFVARLTEDHNLVMKIMAEKNKKFFEITGDNPESLIKVVGMGRYDSEKAVYEPVSLDLQPVTCAGATIRAGEYLLLCSDGLAGSLSCIHEHEKEQRLKAVLDKYGSAELREAARQLVRTADDDKGSDNISVALLTAEYEDISEKTHDSVPSMKGKENNGRRNLIENPSEQGSASQLRKKP